jgi:hypothetical protein
MKLQIQVYKFLFISFISFIYFIPKPFALNRIWLVRHCDKPISTSDPCCSKLGYERAAQWHLYFEKYIQKRDKVKIYSSNFNEKKICINNIKYLPDSSCQKSQRMFLTAYYLQNTFKDDVIDLSPTIDNDYCVGEKDKLLSAILKDMVVTDAIVVWEHKEIVDIIRNFDIQIKKWKNKFKNIYNLVFMIDVQRRQLFYDCFDFDKNAITNCSEVNDMGKWLSNFNSIDKYSGALYTTSQYPTNYKIEINYIKIIFFTVCFLFFLVCFVNIIIQIIIRRNRRREYTVII